MRLVTAIKMLCRAFVTGDEYAKYFLAQKASNAIYPKYKFSDFGTLWLEDADFLEWFERFHGTRKSHSLDRKFMVNQFAKWARTVEGDTAECGALHGATSYLICQNVRGTGKQHHIFDSFGGLSQPDRQHDGSYWRTGDLSASQEECQENLKEFDFVRYYQGWIPTRFAEVADRRFSFVHIDVDLYEPTRDSLRFFWERMNRFAVMICDDYGSSWCPGAKRAMDEFFEGCETILHFTTGQGVVIKRS